MAWWGKLAGGAFGFMLGGPLAAILGAALGHQFDKGLERVSGQALPPGDQERIQAAFFTATFSVMGHIAKADGHVSKSEIALAEEVMRSMHLNAQQRRAAIDLFNEGKRKDFPLDDAIRQLRRECHRRTTLLRIFLEIQIQAALADGRLDANENRVLLHVARLLGFTARQVEQLLHMLGATAGIDAGASELERAYETIGVKPGASQAEVKKAYRRLMNQHHPDKLVAKGLPEEMIELATQKTQQIRSAYEVIKRSQGH